MTETLPRRRARVPRPTREERAAAGRAVRHHVPLTTHAGLATEGRADPVELLESQAVSRLPELVPIRYGRMIGSPFAHYRGSALIMASDVACSPHSGLEVQLCGDAHMSNFGFYATPERRLVFDINDFDETHPGPFEWDVKRLAASLAVAGRDNGYSRKKRRRIIQGCAAGYRRAMIELAGQGNLTVWYSHLDADGVLREVRAQLDARRRSSTKVALDKARRKDSLQALAKLTTVVDGHPRILNQPPLLVPVEDLVSVEEARTTYESLEGLVRSYGRTLQRDRRQLLDQFALVQMARKVVGVGSVGSSSSKASTAATRSSSRRRKLNPQCSRASSRRDRSGTRARGS